MLLVTLLAVACGGGNAMPRQDEGIKVEIVNGALPMPTAEAPQVLVAPSMQLPPVGQSGANATLPLLVPPVVNGAGPVTTQAQATPQATATNAFKPATPPSSFSTTPAPAATSAPSTVRATMDGTAPPTSGRWIDVDVTRYTVRLMSGTEATRTLSPVAVGAQVDTGVYESTQTGTFRVHNKIAGLQYDAPYKTYISDWVGFDAARANGFHSLLKDGQGNVVDPATGRVSNGCIRAGDSAAIFAYAEIGMVATSTTSSVTPHPNCAVA
jgi:hypothetical protein